MRGYTNLGIPSSCTGLSVKILNVDLLQTVHALPRKTCYPENASVCQLVFCSPGYSRTLARYSVLVKYNYRQNARMHENSKNSVFTVGLRSAFFSS